MFKKSFLLACLLIFTISSSVFAFVDTNEHWSKSAVEWAVSYKDGIAKGFPDGSFRPEETLTEAQFLAFTLRAFAGTGDAKEGQQWYEPYYDFAEEMNYPVSSYPNAVISRTSVAEILAGTQGVNVSGRMAIAYLLVKGLSKGKVPGEVSINNYGENDVLKRGESMQFIKNVVDKGLSGAIERPFNPSNLDDVFTDKEKEIYDGLLAGKKYDEDWNEVGGTPEGKEEPQPNYSSEVIVEGNHYIIRYNANERFKNEKYIIRKRPEAIGTGADVLTIWPTKNFGRVQITCTSHPEFNTLDYYGSISDMTAARKQYQIKGMGYDIEVVKGMVIELESADGDRFTVTI